MDAWQKLLLERAKEQDLHCFRFHLSDDAACFSVMGLSDIYEIEIFQDADLWPPTCTCEDHAWRRGAVLCKHVLLCLKLMGVEDQWLEDYSWVPSQEDIYVFMRNVQPANVNEAYRCEAQKGVASFDRPADAIDWAEWR